MAFTVQFVDKIDASPTVRLDLNTGIWNVTREGTDWGFPELNRAIVNNGLVDGATIPTSAYGTRELTLRLLVDTSDADAVATAAQSLFRELNRKTNIVKFQPETTAPVFFRTFRSRPEQVDIPVTGAEEFITVRILAEPFAVGLREDVTGVSVSHNPASANGRMFDIAAASVKGDVDTPAFIRISGGSDPLVVLGIRRHGTPSTPTYFRQCEAMTQGTDTSTQANDAAMSGSGNNFSRTSFGTASMTTRLSDDMANWLGETVDARGRYRIFVRSRKSSAGSSGDHVVRFRIGGASTLSLVTGDSINVPGATGPFLLELGTIQVPVGSDPKTLGPSGTELAPQGAYFELQAQRVTGTATLDWDYVFAVPADEGYTKADFSGLQAVAGTFPADGDNLYLDGYTDSAYAADADVLTTGKVFSHSGHPLESGFLKLTPNQVNRIFALIQRSSTSDIVTGSDTITVSYWPLYLFDRPATT
jgi:hypothetical protein